ncbi:MAG: hypothetical protein QM783_17270 [Phycisphaerales bacterium]
MKSKLKRAGRKRRAAGWTLLALGVLVAGVWAASGRWLLGYGAASWGAGFHMGVIYFNNETVGTKGWRAEMTESFRLYWVVGGSNRRNNVEPVPQPTRLWLLRRDRTGYRATDVCFWPVPLLLWTPAALLLRSSILARRRANTGACPKCGYSLAGLGEGAACPECGKGAGAT